MRKFLVEELEGSYRDPETQEEYAYVKHKSVQLKETEPFFLTYSKQILALYNSDVLNATTKVLYKMLEYAEWNTGKVCMPADRVEEVLEICHISRATYHRAIKELLSIGVIIKGKGSYTIAENMFWKGELKAREAVMKAKMQVTFTPIFPVNEEAE